MRERIFQIVQRARPGDRVSHAYDIFIVAVAFLSIVPLMFRPQDVDSAQALVLNMVDVVTVYILFLDYILRWMTHDIKTGKTGWREFAKYPFTPLAVIDLLAILPSLGVLPESFKFLRVLRVTKMFRYSKQLTIVANVFRSEKNTLLSVLVVALMYIFVSGLIMFVNEPETFDNFFDALYWATTALTTVGYGDVYPTTDLGKFISMASSLFGIAVIALPAGIITGGFLEEIRQCQEDREAYFRRSHVDRPAFKGRAIGSYGGMRAYAEAHPKIVAYAVVMAACILLNEGLYALSGALGLPLWLDTTGTALAAVLLEPAAGLIVGFVNNLVLAVQFGNAGNLLYYCLSAISALVFGILFGRGRKISPRSFAWAALFLVAAESAISTLLAFSLAGGALTTAAEQQYGAWLATAGLPGPAAVFGALLVDKLIDTAAVFVIVFAVSRSVIGSRIDPARWFGSGEAERGSEAPQTVAPGTRYVLGIDVGGAHTKAAAFTTAGELVGSHAFDSQRVLADGSHAQLAREVRSLLDRGGVDAAAIEAIGLAVPSAVAAEASMRLYPHIDLDLRAYQSFLRTMAPKARIVVVEDAEAAVQGDLWHGATCDSGEGAHAVLVSLGTRAIASGRGIASPEEFGRLRVDGGEACLDERASAPALAALAGVSDASAVFDGAAQGEPAAQAALERFADALGFALAQLACVVGPDSFILAGGLSERADLYLDAVRARYRACAPAAYRDASFAVSPLGGSCGVHGAAKRALDALESCEGAPAR